MKNSSRNINNKSKLNIVIALACEAKPLIANYGLKKIRAINHFEVYTNFNRSLNLIVSGVGKLNAASATTFLYMLNEQKSYQCFLNIGMAGSLQDNIAECFLIHKICDKSTGRFFYPYMAKLSAENSKAVMTIDTPSSNYVDDYLYDMEASAFFHSATKFVSHEQVQSLKIISDNKTNSINHITPKMVSKFITENFFKIDKIVKYLSELSESEEEAKVPTNYFSEITSLYRFSEYEKYQLNELLRKLRIIFPNEDIGLYVNHVKTGKELIKVIKSKLDAANYTW